MIFRALRKAPDKRVANEVYFMVAEASRREPFFVDAGAPDNVEGRFEVLSIHMFLVLRRLKQDGDRARRFSQYLFDAFFNSMDDALRELGVGDMSIGKRIRNMAEAFYGRTGAYDEALEKGDAELLSAAIARNIYGVEDIPAGANEIARYMMKTDQVLKETGIDDIFKGAFAFPPIQMDPTTDAASAK